MKSVLITGVSGGIGQATARCLVECGWHVFGVDAEESAANNDLSSFWQGDVAEESFWTETVIPELRSVGINGLVNNAAVQYCTSIENTTLKEWNQTMAVNLGAAFLATKHIAPLIREAGGSIVNVSSVHGMATSPGRAAYAASKGGLMAFTRAAALELSNQGIRVNAVLPGAVDTGMLVEGLKRNGGNPNEMKCRLAANTPLKRIAAPNEVSATIQFLLDEDKSSFITGQCFVIDGGVLARLSSE